MRKDLTKDINRELTNMNAEGKIERILSELPELIEQLKQEMFEEGYNQALEESAEKHCHTTEKGK